MWTSIMSSVGGLLSDSRFVALGVGMVAIVLLISSIRKRQHQLRQPLPKVPEAPRTAPLNPGVSIRRDLDELMVELQELSRRISAEIDTRFAKLEAAIRDADRRIVALNRLSRQGAGVTGEPSSAVNGQDIRHAVVYELADAGLTPVEIARDLGRTPGEVELILNLRKQAAT